MARLANIGFETNSTDANVEITTSSGSPTIQSTTKRSGTYALQITSLASATKKYVSFTYNASSIKVWIRTYLYISTLPSADNCIISFHASGSAPGITDSGIVLTSGGLLKYMSSSGNQVGVSSSALSTGQWYRIECIADVSDISSAYELKVDGTSVTSGTFLGGGGNALALGGNLYGESQTQGNWYFDDVAINDASGSAQTSYPGAGRLVLALPTGAGDNAATTGIYSYINEIPPSTDATSGSTMIELDANPTNAEYEMTNSSTLGIASTDSIVLIQPMAFMREQTSGASNYMLRIKSASGGTTDTSSSLDCGDTTPRMNPSGTTTFGNKYMSYTDPTTTAAWTATGTNSIDNMQVGVGTTDGNPDTWCLWLGAYIEYSYPEITQASYRYYEDGTEAGATAIDNQDTNITRDVTSDSNLQLRIRLQETIGTAGLSTDDFQLQYEKNDSGSWIGVGEFVVDSYSESNYSSNRRLANTIFFTYAGQSFTGNGTTLSKIILYAKKTGSPTGNTTIKIYAHTGTFGTDGEPTGAVLATSDDFDLSTLSTSFALETFTFSGANQINLVSGTKYFLVISNTGNNSSNTLDLGEDNSSPTHSGNLALSADGSSWTTDDTTDLCFYVYGTSTEVIGYNSGSLTDGNATTNRLGAGTGSFVAGEISEDGLVDDHQITASNYTEYLYSLTVVSSAVANNDTLDFRVLLNGAITNMTYSVTPRITVSKTGGGGGGITDWPKFQERGFWTPTVT